MRATRLITIVLSLCAITMLGSTVHADNEVSVVRKFVGGPHGQIHVRLAQSKDRNCTQTPLVLFHPTPATGDYFAGLMALLATDRTVIAIDTPGYGDSALPPEPPVIGDYANAMAIALENLGYGAGRGDRVDVLGYHTGALIAAELARSQPELVRRVVLPGLPFFTGDARIEAYRRNATPELDVQMDGSHLSKPWQHAIIAVDDGVSLQRSQELFAEAIQSYPHGWWGYHAAFQYESELHFPEVEQPVLLLSTEGSLQAETAAAAAYFKDATYVHLKDYRYGVFEVGTEALEEEIRAFLDN